MLAVANGLAASSQGGIFRTALSAAADSAPSWTDQMQAWGSLVAAVAAVITGVIAVWAVFVAGGQLREMRQQRREQAQPYVVAAMEHSAAAQSIIELVLKNLGTTAAHDITLESAPPLTRAKPIPGSPEVWPVGTRIPTLVPGQEWRTMWDTGPEHLALAAQQPMEHRIVVRFKDSSGVPLLFEGILDWRTLQAGLYVDTKTVHHAAKSLGAIEKTLAMWTERGGKGVAVVARDGAAADARRRQALHELRSGSTAEEEADESESSHQPVDGKAPESDPGDGAAVHGLGRALRFGQSLRRQRAGTTAYRGPGAS